MKKQHCELYPFLQATAGNWRNAAYIACKSCPYGRSPLCAGFLLTTGADGAPIILSADLFHKQTGEYPDQSECTAILTRSAFESIYGQWLKWQVTDSAACTLLQLLS